MDLSAFQLLKHNARTNTATRLHDTPIVHYGRIIKVIDIQTVIVEAIIQISISKEVYTVTLLNLSSALLEVNAWPKIGDKVLLLFLQRHDPGMFVYETVKNSDATGYNMFSGVGILMSTVKGFASTLLQFYDDGGESAVSMRSNAKWSATFNTELAITFCRAVFNSEDETLISMFFGEGRPLIQRFLSKVTREYGCWEDNDGNLVEVDAAVTETYSQYAPITKNIQGTQDYIIGTDKNGNPTPASIEVELDSDADIIVTSKSCLDAVFKESITLRTDSTALIEISNAIDSLGALVSEFIDLVTELNDITTNLDTTGTAAAQSTGPVAKPQLLALKVKLSTFKSKWGQVFS